jgi:hypothetical protein
MSDLECNGMLKYNIVINDVSPLPDGFKLGNLLNTGSEKALLSRLTRDVDVPLKDTAEVSSS